jgi:FkbH-like protein
MGDGNVETAPTSFAVPPPAAVAKRAALVIAATFDSLGLQGPLSIWLRALVGLEFCTPQWVGYGMVVESIRDEQSAWNANGSGVNVLLLRAQDFARALQLSRSQLDAGDGAGDGGEASTTEAAIAALLDALRDSCSRRRGPTVVLLPPTSDADASSCAAQRSLAALLWTMRGVTVYDEANLRGSLGSVHYHSPFLDRVAHAPYSPAACSAFAGVIVRELARALAPRKKVYCLDCDNTLWGGAVGELGAAGVSMGDEWLRVQRHFVVLQQRGALLCLISRNHEADVRAVLRERRDEMALHEEHLVAIRADWAPKSRHVLELASALCLGLASFVFVDDSPSECADVAAHCALHGVSVVLLPRDPKMAEPFLESCWALDEERARFGPEPAVLTAEDAERTALYRQLDERKQFVRGQSAVSSAATGASASASLDAFAASLNLRVDVRPLDRRAESSGALRAAQLSERTNQHNACKWALSAPRLLACTAGSTCLTVEASDRFGHHGLVGLIVLDEAVMAKSTSPPVTLLAPQEAVRAGLIRQSTQGESAADDEEESEKGSSDKAAGAVGSSDKAAGAGESTVESAGGGRGCGGNGGCGCGGCAPPPPPAAASCASLSSSAPLLDAATVLHVRCWRLHPSACKCSPRRHLPQVRCWMLSCRSLHLGIEHLMIRHLARVAAARGAI